MAFRAFRELMDSVLCYRDRMIRSSEPNVAQMISHRLMLIWLLAKVKKSCEYEADGRGVPTGRQISRSACLS